MQPARAAMLIVAVLAALLLAGCGGHNNVIIPTNKGTVNITVALAKSAAAAQINTQGQAEKITSVKIEITGTEMEPISQILTFDPVKKEASGTVQVPQGIDRLFVASALDAAGSILFKGQATADVNAGKVTPVTIDLWPTAVYGQIFLNVGINNPYLGIGKLKGLCYSPFRDGQDPNRQIFPTPEQIDEDLAILAPKVEAIRVYSSVGVIGTVPAKARALGMKCFAQAWIGRDAAANEAELEALIAIGQAGNADALIVGSEVLLRGDQFSNDLITMIDRVKAACPSIPVSYNDVYGVINSQSDLVAHCDFLLVNYYPFWEGTQFDSALASLDKQYQKTCDIYPGKEVIIGETGWPSAGSDQGQASPTAVNQRRYLSQFTAWAAAKGARFFLFEAFDENWKTREGTVGTHWGLWNSDRNPKPEILKVYFKGGA